MTIKYHFFGKEVFDHQALKDHNDKADLKRMLEKQGFIDCDRVVFVHQVHGNQAITISSVKQIPPSDYLPEADCIVTNLEGLIIGVVTADCAPILMFDQKDKVVAAIHSGWRGAFDGVIQNAILEMLKLGAKLPNIQAVVGPSIRQKSYEISQEFYNQFLKQKQSNQKFFIATIKSDHYLFDLPAYIKEILAEEGIKNIFDDEVDTYENSNQFFSYRRKTHLGEAEKHGRNISVIQIS